MCCSCYGRGEVKGHCAAICTKLQKMVIGLINDRKNDNHEVEPRGSEGERSCIQSSREAE